jgi:GT2 family glycosyltransferase
VNPDTLSHPDWLRTALSALDSDKDIGACQPKILLYDDRARLNSKGNQANFLFFVWPDGYGAADFEESLPRVIPYASGAAAVYKRECLDRTGVFDESYFMYHDDFDLGIRSFLVGYNTIYSPESIIMHKYRFKESPQRYFLLERNRLISLVKTYRWKTLLVMTPALVLVEVSVLIHSMRGGWLRKKIAAYGSLTVGLPRILASRSSVQNTRVRSDSDLIHILRGGLEYSVFEGSTAVRRGNRLLDRYREFLGDFDL